MCLLLLSSSYYYYYYRYIIIIIIIIIIQQNIFLGREKHPLRKPEIFTWVYKTTHLGRKKNRLGMTKEYSRNATMIQFQR